VFKICRLILTTYLYIYYIFYLVRKNGQCAKGVKVRKNEAKWMENRKRWQINVQSDGERRTFIDTVPGTKGKVLAEKKADKWLDEKLVDENKRCEFMLDRWLASMDGVASKPHCRQCKGFVKNWIKPIVGLKRVGKVTKADWQECIDNGFKKKDLSEKVS